MKEFNNKQKIFKLAVMGILIALVIVLQTIATGIKIGPVPITLTLVPIVIGSIIYGPLAGGILGFVFGMITLIAGITGTDAFCNILFQASPILTIIMCLLKAIAAGVVAGYLFRLLYKVTKNQLLSCFLSSIIAPIVNTGIFALFMLLVFKNEFATIVPSGVDIVYYLFIGIIGINFIIEAIINASLGGAIARITLYFKKKFYI